MTADLAGDFAELFDAANWVEAELGVELGGPQVRWFRLAWGHGDAGGMLRTAGWLAGRTTRDVGYLGYSVGVNHQAAGSRHDHVVGVQADPALTVVTLCVYEDVLKPCDGRCPIRSDGSSPPRPTAMSKQWCQVGPSLVAPYSCPNP